MKAKDEMRVSKRWKNVLGESSISLHMFFSHEEGSKSCFWDSDLEKMDMSISKDSIRKLLVHLIRNSADQ